MLLCLPFFFNFVLWEIKQIDKINHDSFPLFSLVCVLNVLKVMPPIIPDRSVVIGNVLKNALNVLLCTSMSHFVFHTVSSGCFELLIEGRIYNIASYKNKVLPSVLGMKIK